MSDQTQVACLQSATAVADLFPEVAAMFKQPIEGVWHLLWLVLRLVAMDEGLMACECEAGVAWGKYQGRTPARGPVNAFLRWCAKENMAKFLHTCAEVDFTDRAPVDVVAQTVVLPGLGTLTRRANNTLVMTLGNVTVPIPHDLWYIIAETPVWLAYSFVMLLPAGAAVHRPDVEDQLREEWYNMQ